MSAALRLYAPSIVLLLWAGAWSIGVRGDSVIGVGLFLLGATTVLAEQERARRRRA